MSFYLPLLFVNVCVITESYDNVKCCISQIICFLKCCAVKYFLFECAWSTFWLSVFRLTFPHLQSLLLFGFLRESWKSFPRIPKRISTHIFQVLLIRDKLSSGRSFPTQPLCKSEWKTLYPPCESGFIFGHKSARIFQPMTDKLFETMINTCIFKGIVPPKNERFGKTF